MKALRRHEEQVSVPADVFAGRSSWCMVDGDAFEVVPELPLLADHVITDAPYNTRTHEEARVRTRTKSGKRGFRNINLDFDAVDVARTTPMLLGAAKRWVIAFCALEDLGVYAAHAGRHWVRSGIWDRPDGMPQISGDRPAQGAEGIAIMRGEGDCRLQWNGGGKRGVWRCGIERDERHHPTPKPLALMLELIADFTLPGDIVLDPFAGSGTTGIAALRLGRRFIGFEKNKTYATVARKRIAADVRGLSLEDAAQGQTTIFDVLGGNNGK